MLGLDGHGQKEIPRDFNSLTMEGDVHASKHHTPMQ